MPQSHLKTNQTYTPKTSWAAPDRGLHWLAATSMIGAASLTSQGDTLHATFGWMTLGLLLFLQVRYSRLNTPNPVLWIVTAAIVVFNLSDWLAPDGTIHIVATLVGLVLAAFYCATVLFESLQRVTARMVY